MDPQGRVTTHSTAPYALAWPLNHILAAGCDRKVILYDRDGKPLRIFDYSREDEREFTFACSSPSGQAVVLGSYDRLRLYNWNSGKGIWEESATKDIKNIYTVSALSWKRDGTRVACGTLCGALLVFESVLKRTIWKNKYEMTYVGPNQVLIKPVNSSERGTILKSQFGHEIDDVRIMGRDRYIVARTMHTLLLGDLERNLLSEIMWPNSGRNEKFYFDNINVCLIFNVGELSLVEYGENEILGSVRTEFMNPHLISVRLNERRSNNQTEDNKKLAYLLDLKTICVIDLVYGITIAQVSHDAKVDWLELNETGHKLLFRDKKQRLVLFDPRLGRKESILTNCTFVQWVPGSDVVVAQSLNNLCVWYNIDIPERVTLFPIKGEVVDVVRSEGRTEVVVQDGVHQLGYELDEGLVEFGTAIHDNDFGRAILFLENLSKRPEAEGMWQNLAGIAVNLNNLPVAERCFAALGDVSRTHFLKETIKIGEEFAKSTGGHILECPELWARMAILNKEMKTAEQIYLEQNEMDKALEMYQKFHKWEEALDLAQSKGHADSERLRQKHLKWLLESHQEEKAGNLKEREGDYTGAINLYLAAKQPAKAAKLLQNYSYLLNDDELTNRVISALMKADMSELAGDIYEKLNENFKALECYQKGKSFAKAIDLARRIAPNQIVSLEEQWADSLVESRQLDAAINHYIEAGKTMKALDAAITARQWKKAVQIIQVISDTESVLKYYRKIGDYFQSVKDYSTAEVMYVKGGLIKEAVDMYNNAGKWDKAHKIASNYFDGEEVTAMYLSQAQALESSGKFKEAENLYVSIEKPDMAISMYKKHRQYDNMMKLVNIYHPDLVSVTHGHLAQELEASKQYKLAEYHYLMANDWKSVVNMYRAADMWDEAYRIAKTNGGTDAGNQVAFVWAKSLGGDAAVKLLNRFNILDLCIAYCCENYQFEFAFELAKLSNSDKIPTIHYKYALALEDDGKFSEAEEHFIKAGKPKEAISMYIHMKMWDKAEQVAENHDRDSISEVLVLQAKDAVEQGNYSAIETLLLRAQKPEILIMHYQEADMWADALRVCREYLPSKLAALQNMYEKQTGNKGSRDVALLVNHAREFEQSGQYKQAIQCYLKISQTNSVDTETMMKSLMKAADLTAKFVDSDEAIVISRTLGPKLVELRQYGTAAQLYLSCDLVKEAIDAFINGEDWAGARKTARDLKPSLEIYVEKRYKEYLANSGDVDQLADVDVLAALDLLVRQGLWTQCFETAKQKGPQTLHKYVALYATEMIKRGNLTEVVSLYNKYDAPAFPQNYNIYKRICFEMMISNIPDGMEEYEYWSKLRNMLHKVVENVGASTDAKSPVYSEFETLLRIAHYYAARCAYRESKSLIPLATKISIALLRYTDIIPADKAFYEAGMDAKAAGRNNEAFVFLNHYLDICEAIEEENSEIIDSSDFSATDFPSEIPLPRNKAIDNVRHEEVKDWILAVSMDQKIDQTLPLDDRQLYESCLTSPDYAGNPALPCIVTGYPVLTTRERTAVDFMKTGKVANQNDWNTLMMTAKASFSSSLKGVISFINEWCGGIPSFTF
ncbi:UNVERIFIED_CONTAM: hypothetical protein PYX00_008457 [Menopon gallinae]